MDEYCNQGKEDYSDIQDRALGARYVRYMWTYALSITHISAWIQQVFYNGCSRVLEKFVRISGVHVHTGTRPSKQLVLTEELLMA